MDYRDEGQVRTLVYGECYAESLAGIKDPEEPFTLEQMKMLTEEDVDVGYNPIPRLRITWKPTNPACTCAVNIGLCIRYKLMMDFPDSPFKVDIFVREGSHTSAQEVDKQVNDKERVAAALENPDILQLVTTCINYVSSS